ncbi:MAG: FecR family protein [Myxococcota bacterium]
MSWDLGNETRRTLGEPLGDAELQAAWTGVGRRRAQRRVRRARLQSAALALGSFVLGALVFAAFTPWRGRAPEALRLASGAPFDARTLVATDAERSVRLSDGSELVLAPGTRGEVTVNDGLTLALVLEEGEALFDVVPGGGRAWTIRAGPARVEVLGTRFTVALRSPETTEVDVERGHVRVRGLGLPQGQVELRAGDKARVSMPGTAAREAHADSGTTRNAPAEPALAGEPMRAAPAERVRRAWRPAPARRRALQAVDVADVDMDDADVDDADVDGDASAPSEEDAPSAPAGEASSELTAAANAALAEAAALASSPPEARVDEGQALRTSAGAAPAAVAAEDAPDPAAPEERRLRAATFLRLAPAGGPWLLGVESTYRVGPLELGVLGAAGRLVTGDGRVRFGIVGGLLRVPLHRWGRGRLLFSPTLRGELGATMFEGAPTLEGLQGRRARGVHAAGALELLLTLRGSRADAIFGLAAGLAAGLDAETPRDGGVEQLGGTSGAFLQLSLGVALR